MLDMEKEIDLQSIAMLITAIITALATSYSAIKSKKLSDDKNKHEQFIYQDEQTKWVSRLLKVVTTTNDEINEKHVLEVLSCLRPVAKEKPQTSRDEFMGKAITYCNEMYDKNGDFIVLTNKQKVNLRLIGNILLKEHWDYLEKRNNKKQDTKHIGNITDIYDKGTKKLDEKE